MRFLDPFFSEWAHKRPGQTRSLDRAAALMRALDLDPAALPVLGVVGSKGKGSTATYAAAALGAAGLRTVLATGPSFRSYRERVRVDGASVTDEEMDALGRRIDEARRRLPSVEESGGHLAPSGLFLVAALLRAHEVGADVCVLEAGAGGHRDELRLIGPDVVAMSTVFGEHLGVLGDTVPEIAREKARVAGARTRALVTLPQTGEVTEAVVEALAGATDGRVAAETVDPALRMLDVLGRPRPDRARLHEVLGTVRLPARLSRHAVPGAEAAEVVVDSAINGTGVAAALAHARDLWGGVDHVLLCLPDHKDVTGVVESLGGLPVTAVVLPEDHLRFDRALPDHWRTVAAEDLSPALLAGLGRRILALGTVYFTGRVLEAVQAPTDRLFDTGRG
jgi:dihydrofolate synthase/folylpolyglutamate synthase